MLGYTETDVEEMKTALEYAMQDANDSGEEKQYDELMKVFDFLDGLLMEGHI